VHRHWGWCINVGANVADTIDLLHARQKYQPNSTSEAHARIVWVEPGWLGIIPHNEFFCTHHLVMASRLPMPIALKTQRSHRCRIMASPDLNCPHDLTSSNGRHRRADNCSPDANPGETDIAFFWL
jgi:hypothetical protein